MINIPLSLTPDFSAAEYHIHACPLTIEGFEGLSSNLGVLVADTGGHPEVITPQCRVICNIDKRKETTRQPMDVLADNSNKYNGAPLYIERAYGGRVLVSVYGRRSKSIPTPFHRIRLKGPNANLYAVNCIRYDRTQPIEAVGVDFVGEDRIFCVLPIPLHNAAERLEKMFTNWLDSGPDTAYKAAHSIYGLYLGVDLHTEPSKVRGCINRRAKLDEMAQDMQRGGWNVYGENLLGAFHGWLTYHQRILSGSLNEEIFSDAKSSGDMVHSAYLDFAAVWEIFSHLSE